MINFLLNNEADLAGIGVGMISFALLTLSGSFAIGIKGKLFKQN